MDSTRAVLAVTLAAALFIGACSSTSNSQSGAGGNRATGGASSSGAGGTGATPGTATGGGSCTNVTACGGNAVGTWTVTSSCLAVSGQLDLSSFGIGCASAPVSGALQVSGTWTAKSDGSYVDATITSGTETLTLAAACLKFSGTTTTCDAISGPLQGLGYSDVACASSADGGCTCSAKVQQSGGLGVVSSAASGTGNYVTSGNTITADETTAYAYCVAGGKLTLTPQPATPTVTGTIVLQSAGDSPAGGGGTIGSGGAAGSRAATGGAAGHGSGGAAATGGSGGGAGSVGAGGGAMGVYQGPCDIYAAGNTPCVAAYSMARLLSSKYSGPLYQVRKGGSKAGSGGMTMDIGTVGGAFGDAATQDVFCGTSSCTVSKLYDQSGKGNDLTVAPAGCYVTTPDNESDAKAHTVTVSGHKVYALYMVSKEGYRNDKATGLPTGTASQGTYEIADGSRKPIDMGCCWDFGNARRDNCYTNGTGTMNTIYFGTGYWGKGTGTGPWFMGDFEAGIWAGGSGDSHAMNSNNPSETMEFAFGTIKTSTSGSTPQYAIRVGNAQSGGLTTAYDGQAPHAWQMDGAVLLGIGGDNSNGGLGTFFEGAVTSGRPSDATDLAVLQNAQAAGYGK